MGDGKKNGVHTDLGINVQFANAVLHGLRGHERAKSLADGKGIVLPIDEKTWQRVFKKEFPDKVPCNEGHMQPLARQCSYYNNGAHGLGYDKSGRFDFGTGPRDKEQRRGQSITGSALAVYTGERSHVTPDEVIKIAKSVWEDWQRNGGHSTPSNVLKRTSGRRHNHVALKRRLREEGNDLEKEGYFERTHVIRKIAQRYGQPKFRARLLNAYQHRCAVSGSNCEWALEAAHINPYSTDGSDNVTNGLLLRADIHTLFDLNLIGIHPKRRTVVIADCLQKTEFKDFEDRPLSMPKDKRLCPDRSALRKRWARFWATRRRSATCCMANSATTAVPQPSSRLQPILDSQSLDRRKMTHIAGHQR
jgi:hypothetical protein